MREASLCTAQCDNNKAEKSVFTKTQMYRFCGVKIGIKNWCINLFAFSLKASVWRLRSDARGATIVVLKFCQSWLWNHAASHRNTQKIFFSLIPNVLTRQRCITLPDIIRGILPGEAPHHLPPVLRGRQWKQNGDRVQICASNDRRRGGQIHGLLQLSVCPNDPKVCGVNTSTRSESSWSGILKFQMSDICLLKLGPPPTEYRQNESKQREVSPTLHNVSATGTAALWSYRRQVCVLVVRPNL